MCLGVERPSVVLGESPSILITQVLQFGKIVLNYLISFPLFFSIPLSGMPIIWMLDLSTCFSVLFPSFDLLLGKFLNFVFETFYWIYHFRCHVLSHLYHSSFLGLWIFIIVSRSSFWGYYRIFKKRAPYAVSNELHTCILFTLASGIIRCFPWMSAVRPYLRVRRSRAGGSDTWAGLLYLGVCRWLFPHQRPGSACPGLSLWAG